MPGPASHRGFVFQASYRIQAGVPVVHLFGRLENGDTFLVRDRRQAPHFYVPADAPARAQPADWQGARLSPSGRVAFGGGATRKVTVPTPQDAPTVRDRLHARGIDTFEADVRFAMRYLIDRNIRGGCGIRGEPRRGSGCRWIFDDPELQPAPVDFQPSVLSFDIETDARAQRLLAIALYGCGVDEVYIVDGRGRVMPEKAIACENERSALDAFCRRVQELDADVLTGWNVIDFDLTVLARMAARLRHPLQLGREPGRMNIRPARGYFGSGQATIPGRLVLDGVDLMRGAFVRMDDYSLDAVARNVLGEGKALAGSAHDRVGEILRNYAGDLEAFARYARTDARLALEIVERLGLVNLAVARSRLTGMPPDRVAASIASFDFLYLAELHRRRIVAPSVSSSDSRVHAAQAGGHVLEPVTGLHEGVWVFDFKSLYPSVIRTYNIDPLGYLGAGEEAEDPIEIAGGARFRRAPGILPGLLDDLFPRREQAKRDGDGVASQAIKILMNSFYGVLGTPACRFYNPAIANAITGQGRRLLLWSKRWFENKGFQVLYGDTDSLFVASGGDARDGTGGASGREAGCITGAGKEGATSRETKCATDRETESATGGGTDGATDCETGGATNRETEGAMGRGTVGATGTATERGSLLARALTADLAEHIRRESRVESRLELQLEKFYRKLFLPVTRGGTGGARKRYAGQIQGRDDVEFTGMEVVRRDWTELAKEVQRELYGRLFRDEPIEHWLCDLVARLRAGALDEWLVYRKGLRKRVEDYTAQTPPHVAAARKSKSAPGRVIAYLITLAGPEPLDNLTAEPDREHYVAKQVKPVAEPVLATLGLNFERVIGDDRQMGLF